MLSACSNKVAYDDEYVSKGEFMMMFAEATSVDMYSDPFCDIELSVESKYFDAASALVEYGLLTKEDAVTRLDDAVTKEFVAELCINKLYFRKNFDINLKDAGKLNDPQACKDAVGHEIVSISNGYFDANEKMTYEDCVAAIDRMLYIDGTTTFEPGEEEIEIVYKDGVIDLTDEIDEEDIIVHNPSDPDFDSVLAAFDGLNEVSYKPSSSGIKVSEMSCKVGQTSKIKEINNSISSYEDAEVGDLVVITLPTSHPKMYKVGDLIVYGLMRNWTFVDYEKQPLALCGIVEEMARPMGYLGYSYKIRIASDEEALAAAKLNKCTKSEMNGWAIKQIREGIPDGIEVEPLEINDSGITVKIKQKVSNNIEHWSEAKYEGDITYSFGIKDIKLTVDGFGDALKGNIDNAVCRLDYTIDSDFDASIKLKGAPANNGNGKFLSNLRRARLTGYNAAGADEIKIARMYMDLGAGFMVETYIYVTVTVEGEIHIGLEAVCGRGFSIKNNKVTYINKTDVKNNLQVNANAEAAVHCDFSLKWGSRKAKPWIDLNLQAGVGIDAQAQVIETAEIEGNQSLTPTYGYYTIEALDYAKANENIDVCFNCEIYWFYQIDGLTDKTLVGKLIRAFDDDFNLSTGKKKTTWKIWHIEDTGIVETCTLLEKDAEKSDDQEQVKEDTGEFKLNSYKVILPEYTCSTVRLIELPVDKDELKYMGNISVKTIDPKIATAHIYDKFIVIEAQGAGSTTLIVETNNKRFKQECSITVEPNSYEE
ncbi:MAG: hypothetical protein IKU23_03375 [Clostridia bacterium]|nr:hypothetical protein [Clostridia bacterium]